MGNEWQNWYGHRTTRGAHRVPPARAPKVLSFRRPRSFVDSDGTQRTIILAIIFMAVVAGILFAWWQSIDRGDDDWSNEPIAWNEVQEVPRAPTDPLDAEWERRRQENPTDASPANGGSASGGAFGFCHSGGGTNCVVDGDTIWLGGVNIRLADIDAPETHEPRCAAEQALGDRATRRLHALVNGGAITLGGVGRDADRYGRKLRIVAVNGTSVGETLVGEGLARWYGSGRRSWC